MAFPISTAAGLTAGWPRVLGAEPRLAFAFTSQNKSLTKLKLIFDLLMFEILLLNEYCV